MHYRTLGRTGIEVSGIGYGAWGIGRSGWVGADDAESLRALRRAMELGVNFLDTALAYGDGHSERLVGRAIKETKSGARVASKIPPKNEEWPARSGVGVEEVYPADWVVECTERSLDNLGLETIDLQQFHVWSDEWTDQGDWADTIGKLRDEGKIRNFGISINDHQPSNALALIKSGLVDTVQVIYNIFDQSPEDELFPVVQNEHVGVIARVPFDEGGLTGKVNPLTTFPIGDFRNLYFSGNRKQEVWERGQAIVDELGVTLDKLPEVALRFCLSHPAVSTVIPGMRTLGYVDANVRAVELGPLTPGQLEILRKYRWVRNFYPGGPSVPLRRVP
ncbi:MAG TPA: aldo/keto reductase [Acidimicrobiales bacterium]|nr:aldo/keto reductase [Acidimicrobiales bacterium]